MGPAESCGRRIIFVILALCSSSLFSVESAKMSQMDDGLVEKGDTLVPDETNSILSRALFWVSPTLNFQTFLFALGNKQ